MATSKEEFQKAITENIQVPQRKFPKIPKSIKERWPDLKKDWEEYDAAIEAWHTGNQTGGSL